MRHVALTAVAALAGAAALPVMGAVPGTAAVQRAAGPRTVTTGGFSAVMSVWCGSAGSCEAGGNYLDRSGNLQGFVIRQQRGVWAREVAVRGLSALNTGGVAEVTSLSCGPAGNCAAGGDYMDKRFADPQGFVVSEKHGVWGKAIKMPGPGKLIPAGHLSKVTSVSCGSAGSCAAAGDYLDRANGQQGFVVSEKNGVWSKAIEVPGLGALNKQRDAEVTSLSCGSAGSCVAGGDYLDRSLNTQGFVVIEKNGVWGKAIEVPGLAALDAGAGGSAEVTSVSCAPAGSCVAGGDYADRSENSQGFVASEKRGVWGKAVELPGLGALNAGTGGIVGIESVSCWSSGNCVTSGDYNDRSQDQQGFVDFEKNGVWGKAVEVPGLGALNTGKSAGVTSVSCRPAGNCAAGGWYTVGRGLEQGFVVSARNGVWGRAIREPGRATVDGQVSSVWCTRGYCAAGGLSITSIPKFSGFGFVVTERAGTWGKPTRMVVPGVTRR